MALGTIPPQAYTKETLAQAYNWLKDQPEEVARYATNPDRLVAIFLRAKKGGLKGPELSTELGCLRVRETNDTQAHLRELLRDPQMAVPPPPPSPPPLPQTHAHAHAHAHEVSLRETSPPFRENQLPRENQLAKLMGPSCFELIQHVKSSLNLESEVEVLRLLVTLGSEKIKTILPAKL